MKIKLRYMKDNILHEKEVIWIFSEKELIGIWINFDKNVVWMEYLNKDEKFKIESWQYSLLLRICQNLQ